MTPSSSFDTGRSAFWRRALDALAEASVVGSYSAFGYRLRAPTFDPADTDVDLTGKVAVITGASSGIGLAAARELLGKGAQVMVVARNAEKLQRAQERISAEVPAHASARLAAARCDLSDLHDVRNLAERLRLLPRLDVLVHNAGLLLPERQLSPQQHEVAFATHVLAPYLLNHLLEDRLVGSAPARVIWVTSGGMYTQKLDLQKAQGLTGTYDGVVAYAQHKRAQVLLMEHFAARWHARGITSNAMHPGWSDTPGVARSLPGFKKLLQPVLRTEEQGADTIVWLASAPRLAGVTGLLFLDRAVRRTEILPGTHHTAADTDALVTLCEELTR